MKKIVLMLMLGALAVSCTKENEASEEFSTQSLKEHTLDNQSKSRYFDVTMTGCINSMGNCFPHDIILTGESMTLLNQLDDLAYGGTNQGIVNFFNAHNNQIGLPTPILNMIVGSPHLSIKKTQGDNIAFYEIFSQNTSLYVLPIR